ncbi:dihydroorotate dehydrogenase electron transfer subunit [Chloroflexota bacterium]
MEQMVARVASTEQVSQDTFVLVLEAPGIASMAEPGQFVMVRCGDLTLRRPLGVHAADERYVALLYRVTGAGTEWLASLQTGSEVDLYGPCGTGFRAPSDGERILLMAGGLGIAPLYFVASRFAKTNETVLVYGGRSSAAMYSPPTVLRTLMPSLSAATSARTVQLTDDGSCGEKGTACDGVGEYLDWADHVYVCGPVPMCRAFAEMVLNADAEVGCKILDAEVSLEVRMACGVGACYGCSIETRTGRRKVCQDGPVFRVGDIMWDEVQV